MAAADFDLDGYDDGVVNMQKYRGNIILFPSAETTPSRKKPFYYYVDAAESAGKSISVGYGANHGMLFLIKLILSKSTMFDLEGDNKTDISIFRPSA